MAALDTINFFIWLIPTLVFFLEAGIIVSMIHVFFFRKGFFYEFYKENGDKLIWAGFGIALISLLGSLFYSEVLNYDPCELCWYQRIFMYPLVVILGMAGIRKDNRAVIYALPLAVLGLAVASYHYFQQVFFHLGITESVRNCGLGETSCNYVYLLWYNHTTIPMMALTAFAAIVLLLLAAYKQRNK